MVSVVSKLALIISQKPFNVFILTTSDSYFIYIPFGVAYCLAENWQSYVVIRIFMCKGLWEHDTGTQSPHHENHRLRIIKQMLIKKSDGYFAWLKPLTVGFFFSILRIRRVRIYRDMIEAFQAKDIVTSELKIVMVDAKCKNNPPSVNSLVWNRFPYIRLFIPAQSPCAFRLKNLCTAATCVPRSALITLAVPPCCRTQSTKYWQITEGSFLVEPTLSHKILCKSQRT